MFSYYEHLVFANYVNLILLLFLPKESWSSSDIQVVRFCIWSQLVPLTDTFLTIEFEILCQLTNFLNDCLVFRLFVIEVLSVKYSTMLFPIHGILLYLLLDCVSAKTPINVNHFTIKSGSTKMGQQSSQLQLLFQTISREIVCIFLAKNVWITFNSNMILFLYTHSH